ncbi:MAG: hypothetical protein LLG00_10165 [Planctomycetaceae bacterium]|nr:hypothetical protein [Planctomycetaceae bacterium]
MFTATLVCLGLSACIFAGLVCYRIISVMKAARVANSSRHLVSWDNVKTAVAGRYARYERKEGPWQRALRSWAGTLIICAGMCMVGVALEVQYNRPITVKNVVSGFVQQPRVSAQMCKPRMHQNQATTNRINYKSQQKSAQPAVQKTTQQRTSQTVSSDSKSTN